MGRRRFLATAALGAGAGCAGDGGEAPTRPTSAVATATPSTVAETSGATTADGSARPGWDPRVEGE